MYQGGKTVFCFMSTIRFLLFLFRSKTTKRFRCLLRGFFPYFYDQGNS